MIKAYVMNTCPDCMKIKQLIADDPRFQMVDIGEHVRNLKEFMRLRDIHPKFKVARERGLIGIPSFLMEDGSITFKPEEVGIVLAPEEKTDGAVCSIDGTGC